MSITKNQVSDLPVMIQCSAPATVVNKKRKNTNNHSIRCTLQLNKRLLYVNLMCYPSVHKQDLIT